MEEIEIRPYRPGDEKAILETFNLVFGEVCGEGYIDRTLEHWEWEFKRNPEGERIMLAVTRDGTVAAQYAGVPMAAKGPGGRIGMVHAVDSMVHPDFRKGLKKPGLFVKVARAWFDHIEELGKEAIGFGYPIRPAYRMGSRYLGYTLVRIIDYLVGEVGSMKPDRDALAEYDVKEITGLPREETDALFREWAEDLNLGVVRDYRYLDWRYIQCPSIDYHVVSVERRGDLLGLAIVKARDALVPDSVTIAEWIVLQREREAAKALLSYILERGRELGNERILFVVPPWRWEWRFFIDFGFKVIPSSEYLERRLCFYKWQGDYTKEWMADNWYYTLGDSDLV